MIPAKSVDVVGINRIADALRFHPHEQYRLDGIDLNDITGLVLRLESSIVDAAELALWRDRLRLILDDAFRNGVLHWEKDQ